MLSAFELWPASSNKFELHTGATIVYYNETFGLYILKLKTTGKNNSGQHGQEDKPHLGSIKIYSLGSMRFITSSF